MVQKPNKDILNYYENFSEASRLKSPLGQLEFERTKEIISRYIPDPPSVILDIGGGTGPYCRWLNSLGYETHLIDPAPNLIEEAKKLEETEPYGKISSYTVGDSRKIDFRDNSFDAVLLFGPLYHLTEKSDRIQTLREAYRVLKKNGIIFAAGISRMASAIDGILYGLLKDNTFMSIIEKDLETGQHRNPTDNTIYFTDAYFHLPLELQEEVEEIFLKTLGLLPIEGIASITPNINDIMENSEWRNSLFDIIRRTENIPSVTGVTSHIMCIAKKSV